MKVVLVHPTGNRNVRAVINALDKAGMLAMFNTTIATDQKAMWLKPLPKVVREELNRRTFPLSSEQVETQPFLELSRMVLPSIGLKHFVRHEFGWASVDAVYKCLDRKVAKCLHQLVKAKEVDTVYAYEDGALETFKQAKALGLKCVYDLPIAYWETGRRLMTEEAERLPKWAITLGGGIKDSQAKLERKTQELELADVVVGPGQFVMGSLPTWASGKKTIMSPFGSPENSGCVNIKGDVYEVSPKRPLRVLFVGSMGQRKGLGDLFAAIKLLKETNIELVVMGSLLAPIDFYKNELPNFAYEPGRPHDQVLALMRSCDVFCLPSIVEGRALVMQEAMSQGLPLIITPNTGGADLIKEGQTGFLVPIRSPEAIAEKLAWFTENRAEIPRMATMARKHAATYTWEAYGTKIVEVLA